MCRRNPKTQLCGVALDLFYHTIPKKANRAACRTKAADFARNQRLFGFSTTISCYVTRIQKLRQYRTNRQESLTRGFRQKRCKTAGILCVFQSFSTNFWRKRVPGVPTKAQQSGFGGERRHSEATELLPSKGQNEGYEACADAIRRRTLRCCPRSATPLRTRSVALPAYWTGYCSRPAA